MRPTHRTALPLLIAVALVALAPAAAAQKPPPKPKPGEEEETKPPPRPPRPKPGAGGPPPPRLLVSSDMGCVLELDGEEIGALVKDVPAEFTIRPGEHLLQAFPHEIEGPVWKETLKAPDTGQVVATIELRKVVDAWKKEMENVDRFAVRENSVEDTETGLVWTRNVSPEMRWEDVQDYCARKRVDGVGGWRLPTTDELSKLHWPDHESPRQETVRDDGRWTILGKRKGELQVLPRLVFEPFDHNSVAALWVRDAEERVACTFLGGFQCSVERKKTQASAFCVREATP